MRLTDHEGRPRDFFFEAQKHAMHLRTEFTARQLAIYELYQRTVNLPGSVAEFGVRNGANYYYLARLIEIFSAGQRHDGISARHLHGFDTFAGFPSISSEDVSPMSWPDMKVGGVPTDREVFFRDFEAFKSKSPIGKRLHIHEGDVLETLPTFLAQTPGARFSFIFLDLDLYAPTKLCLELLWDRLLSGAVIALDEYGLPEFPGETRAVDEFLGSKSIPLQSFPWCYCPSAFIVKP